MEEILTHFNYHSDLLLKTFYNEDIRGKLYEHKENSEFRIIVFEDNMIYQCDCDGNITDTYLSNMREIESRFKLFKGCKFM